MQTVSINIFEQSSAFLCGYYFSSCISGLCANSLDKKYSTIELVLSAVITSIFFFVVVGAVMTPSDISVPQYVIIAFLLPFRLDVIS